jgi:hypothetical protein
MKLKVIGYHNGQRFMDVVQASTWREGISSVAEERPGQLRILRIIEPQNESCPVGVNQQGGVTTTQTY